MEAKHPVTGAVPSDRTQKELSRLKDGWLESKMQLRSRRLLKSVIVLVVGIVALIIGIGAISKATDSTGALVVGVVGLNVGIFAVMYGLGATLFRFYDGPRYENELKWAHETRDKVQQWYDAYDADAPPDAVAAIVTHRGAVEKLYVVGHCSYEVTQISVQY